MEEELLSKHCSRNNGNYQAYFQLIERQHLDTILLSKLDDSIFASRISNQSMPESCHNLFGEVEALYQFLEQNASDPQKMVISDIGTISLFENIPSKSKLIKVNCAYQTEKVSNIEEIHRFYLKIIRQWQSQQPEQKKQIPALLVGQKAISSAKCINRNYSFQKINLTVDMQGNPFLKSFSKKANAIQIEDYVSKRIKLYFKEVVPKGKCVYFTIRIVNTKANNFGFGVIDRKEQRENKSLFSMCYDFNTGDLKDSNFIKELGQCRWRKVGRPLHDIRNAVLRMQVNMKERRLAFYCNNDWVCETVLNNYLMEREIIPYISVKHQGDQFLLNDE